VDPLHSNDISGRFIEYTLDRPDVQRVWQDFTHHDFVKGIGQGNLPLERFKTYLVQDYLYLVSEHQQIKKRFAH
jgi:thiaminase